LKNHKRLSFYAFFPTARAFFEKICSKRDAVDAGAEWTSHASGIANLFGTSYHTAIAHDLSKNRAKSEATRQPDTEIIFEIF